MKHYGDITKINGYELPIVDCITGGSPCQDLSVAGKRAGLDGERSGLFMEQIRIVKEMREHDRATGRTGFNIRPRYLVWENVPGAFSSNKGKDFQAVLTEIIKIAEPDAPDVPMPDKNKWSKSGCLYDDMGRWSVAWRVHDAQFWGVPQRRKRIALIADFGGLSAPEILFERKGLRGDFAESGEEGQGVAGAAGDSINKSGTDITVLPFDTTQVTSVKNWSNPKYGDPCHPLASGAHPPAISFQERTGALSTFNNQSVLPAVYENHSQDSRYRPLGETCETISQKYGTGGNNQPLVLKPLCIGNGQADISSHITEDVSQTLNCMHDQMAVCIGNGQLHDAIAPSTEISKTLNCMCDPMKIINRSTVRRLTPMECERLQGFPDGWTDIGEWIDSKGKKHKEADSPRYKALGNSIAIPFWFYLLRRISAQYERPATLGSLFDGISGFPLCWEKCNGHGTALWTSEIEEFPIAVCKKHFGDEDEGIVGDVREYL